LETGESADDAATERAAGAEAAQAETEADACPVDNEGKISVEFPGGHWEG
jgi:hypothetical protein